MIIWSYPAVPYSILFYSILILGLIRNLHWFLNFQAEQMKRRSKFHFLMQLQYGKNRLEEQFFHITTL